MLSLLLLAAGCKDKNGMTNPPPPEPEPDPPVITEISPERGKSGTEVTITGSNFGATPGENAVTFNGVDASVTSVATTATGETELQVLVPEGAQTGVVSVTVAGQTAVGPVFTWFPDNTRFVHPEGADGGNDCFEPAHPCETIQWAIDASDPGDVVEIAAGVYTETLVISNSISLKGAGQDSETGTVIQAHEQPGMASDRVIGVFSSSNDGAVVSLNDLTIRHGRSDVSGGGLLSLLATVNVTNVTIERNQSAPSGEIFTGCNGFTPANGGGGIFALCSSLTLTNVRFIGNESLQFGGGLAIHDADSATLTNVDFEGNRAVRGGGGMRVSGSTVLRNVTFTGNRADTWGGGMFVEDSEATLTNVQFFNNISDRGGAMYNFTGSEVLLTNATISGNRATLEGGGLRNAEGSDITLLHSIVWGNTADGDGDEIASRSGSRTALLVGLYRSDLDRHIVIEGDSARSPVNLSEDPRFVSEGGGDLRLGAGSPAVDAGNMTFVDLSDFPADENGDPIDLDDNPRIVNDQIDLGAYEHQEN